jgi:hypothetical protein
LLVTNANKCSKILGSTTKPDGVLKGSSKTTGAKDIADARIRKP